MYVPRLVRFVADQEDVKYYMSQVFKDNKHNSLNEKILRYFLLDIICSLQFTNFFKIPSPKTVRFSEQRMSADEYLSISSHLKVTIAYALSQYG